MPPSGARRSSLRVVALPGSLARDSVCRSVLRAARRRAPAGMRIETFEEMGRVPLFDRGLGASDGPPESARRLRSEVAAADALLITTPEHNQSAPALVLNAIEWLSLGPGAGQLVGMPVALVGVDGGPRGTRLAQRTLRQVLFTAQAFVFDARSLDLGRDMERGGKGLGAELERLTPFLEAVETWILERRREPGSDDVEG